MWDFQASGKIRSCRGRGLAIAGLVMGYLQLVFLLIALPLIAITVPAVVKAVDKAEEVVCIQNMQQIQAAKDMWAMESGAMDGTEVDPDEVARFTDPPVGPTCPAGGVYRYHAIGVSPECSVHGSLDKLLLPASE